MLRRPARIFLAVILILALALPIATAFWTVQSNCNGLAIRLENGYILLAWGRVGHNWGLNLTYTAPESHLADFLQLPRFTADFGTPPRHYLGLPWWTLDGLLFTSAATLYWLTHRKPHPPRLPHRTPPPHPPHPPISR